MKLAVKLSSALVLGIVAVMSVYAAVQISNEVMLSEADAQRARRNGLAWLGVIESVWAREGEPRARELMELSARRSGTAEGFLRVAGLTADAPDRPAPLPRRAPDRRGRSDRTPGPPGRRGPPVAARMGGVANGQAADGDRDREAAGRGAGVRGA